jgi:GT2 family glycosyltransferase
VVLTINIPEDESFIGARPYPVLVIRNVRPQGFGANHNAAFDSSAAELFAVVNPDVRIPRQDWGPFLARFEAVPGMAACSPKVVNSSGGIEDHARPFPTIAQLVSRKLGLGRELVSYPEDRPFEPDWVAGMFVVFRSAAFEPVGGFDSKRYFMYFEDVDICRRLRLAGWSIFVDPRVSVVHDAQRASRRNLRHLVWHVSSAFRYLSGI